MDNLFQSDIRFQQLIAAFENNGWNLKGSVDVSKEWWFEDILQMTFRWRPSGANLYLTFEIDPIDYPKRNIWMIGISSQLPISKKHYIETISLKEIKNMDLDFFVKNLNGLVFNR